MIWESSQASLTHSMDLLTPDHLCRPVSVTWNTGTESGCFRERRAISRDENQLKDKLLFEEHDREREKYGHRYMRTLPGHNDSLISTDMNLMTFRETCVRLGWCGSKYLNLLNYICELKETYLKSVMMESSSGLFTSDNLRWEMQMSLSVTACQSWTYCYAVIRATISSGFMFSLFLTVQKHDVRSVTVPARGVRAVRYVLWIHCIPVNRSKVSLGKTPPQDWISLR